MIPLRALLSRPAIKRGQGSLGALCLTAALSLFVPFSAVSPLFAGEIHLNWYPVTINTDGSPCTDLAGYKIYVGLIPGLYTRVIDVALENKLIVTKLEPRVTYAFEIVAYGAKEKSLSSATLLKSWYPPGGPADLGGRPASDSEITLNWTAAVAGGELTGQNAKKKERSDLLIKGYMVYRDGALVSITSGTYFSDSDLRPNTAYTYLVKAFTRREVISPAAGPVTVTTRSSPPGAPPLKPTIIPVFSTIPFEPAPAQEGAETVFDGLTSLSQISLNSAAAPVWASRDEDIKPKWGTPFFSIPFRDAPADKPTPAAAPPLPDVLTAAPRIALTKTSTTTPVSAQRTAEKSQVPAGAAAHQGRSFDKTVPRHLPPTGAAPADSPVVGTLYAAAAPSGNIPGWTPPGSPRPPQAKVLPVIVDKPLRMEGSRSGDSSTGKAGSPETGPVSMFSGLNPDFFSAARYKGAVPPQKKRRSLSRNRKAAGKPANAGIHQPETAKRNLKPRKYPVKKPAARTALKILGKKTFKKQRTAAWKPVKSVNRPVLVRKVVLNSGGKSQL